MFCLFGTREESFENLEVKPSDIYWPDFLYCPESLLPTLWLPVIGTTPVPVWWELRWPAQVLALWAIQFTGNTMWAKLKPWPFEDTFVGLLILASHSFINSFNKCVLNTLFVENIVVGVMGMQRWIRYGSWLKRIYNLAWGNHLINASLWTSGDGSRVWMDLGKSIFNSVTAEHLKGMWLH